MPDYLVLILVLALAATLGYFRGRKKNKWIAGWIADECENVLRPKHTEYTNIGGTIGYNFTYSLHPPYKEAKGTFTLLPRQSLLYLPLSLLLVRHDRFYLHIYASKKLLAEGHIVREDYFRRMRVPISGIESMIRETAVHDSRRYVLLYTKKVIEAPLKKVLASMKEPENLLHFCSYRDTKVFFIFMNPKQGSVTSTLKDILPHLPSFLVQGGSNNGT